MEWEHQLWHVRPLCAHLQVSQREQLKRTHLIILFHLISPTCVLPKNQCTLLLCVQCRAEDADTLKSRATEVVAPPL
jgi:hypothetical protein